MAAPTIGRRPRWAPGPSARIDWSHPLAAGLLYACWPVNGTWIEHVTGRVMTPESAASPPGLSAWGPTSQTSASGLVGWSLLLPSAPAYPLSYTAVVHRVSNALFAAGEASAVGIVAFTPSGNTPPYVLGLYADSSDLYLGNATGAVYSRVNIGHTGMSDDAVIVGTVDAGVGSTTITGPGLTPTSSASTTVSVDSSLVYLNVGGFVSAPGRGVGWGVALGLVHNRVLSAGERAALQADPFQMLRF